jgi:hypothetical protein
MCNNENISKNTKSKAQSKPTLPTRHNDQNAESTLEWTERKERKECSVYTAVNE